MRQCITIDSEMYPFRIMVFINYKTIDSIKRKIKLSTIKHTDECKKVLDTIDLKLIHGYCVEYLGNIFILLPIFKNEPKCYNVLHHEITHAVDFAGEFIGMRRGKETSEFHANLHGFITEKIYEQIK